jgi:gliding motility-associated-like protein
MRRSIYGKGSKHIKTLFTLIALGLFGLTELFAATFFVDPVTGNDAWNGQQPGFISGLTGPKKTIAGALSAAIANDNIFLADGSYNETVRIGMALNFQFGTAQIRSLQMNAAGVSLNLIGTRLEISDSLQLDNGRIDASSPMVTFTLLNGCRVIGGSKSSYIDGRLFRQNSNTSAAQLFYPVGNKSDYRPFLLQLDQSTSAVTAYGVRLFGAAPPAGTLPATLRNISEIQYWEIRKSGPAVASNMRVVLSYDTDKTDDEVFEPSRLRVAFMKPGSGWRNCGGAGTINRVGSITSTLTADSMGFFALANNSGGFNTLGSRKPIARFGIRGRCAGNSVQMLDSSFSYTGAITGYRWDFNDPSSTADSSRQQNPSWIYSGTGPFNVRLIVNNSNGLSDTLTITHSLLNAPTAAFSVANACFGTAVSFADQTKVTGGDTVRIRNWDLGNGATRSQKSFNYTFAAEGIYNVLLTVTSAAGCTDTQSREITIWPLPKPGFTFARMCLGDTAQFSGSSAPGGDSITVYGWTIGNTLLTNTRDFAHMFSLAGNYSVKYEQQTINGCRDSLRKSIVVYAPPKASFYLDSSIAGNDSMQCFRDNRFVFVNSSQNFQGQRLDGWFRWGDGTRSYFTNRTKQFATGGIKVIQLYLETNKGCKDSLTQYYTVYEPISAAFRFEASCHPAKTFFADSGSISSTIVVRREWDFDDGNTATGDSVSHQYAGPGIFDVRYFIVNTDGCADTSRRQLILSASPTLNFVIEKGRNPFCPGDTLWVRADGGNSVRWLQNGSTNRLFAITSPGPRAAQVYNGPDCFVQNVFNARMYNPPRVVLDRNDTAIIRGRFVPLFARGAITYKWTPASGLSSTNIANPLARPLATTTYTVIGIDSNGCLDTDTIRIEVFEPSRIRIPNIITPNGDFKNETWDLSEIPLFETCSIRVFDNRGRVVFETDNYANDWAGTFAGAPLPEGVYLYHIACPNENEPFKGYLQIIR